MFLDRWQRELEAFKERRWEEALNAFEAAASLYPMDKVSVGYAETCRKFISEPPPPD